MTNAELDRARQQELDDLNCDVASFVMGWPCLTDGSGRYVPSGHPTYYCRKLWDIRGTGPHVNFYPTESHDDFMAAMWSIGPTKRAYVLVNIAEAIRETDNAGRLRDSMAAIFMAPLPTKCAALLRAVGEGEG